jgi:hypothetical protein
MITEIVKLWDKNKSKLEEYFKTHKQEEYQSYDSILSKIFELVINEENDDAFTFDYKRMTKIDDGDYQGTLLFVTPLKTYQPNVEDYVLTHVYYGSCSGCDTLQAISSYDYENLPDEEQVKDYMSLALHMVQNMRWLVSKEENA